MKPLRHLPEPGLFKHAIPDLAGVGRRGIKRLAIVLVGVNIVQVLLATGAVWLQSQPVYSIRTDLEGHTDVIQLHQADGRSLQEVDAFLRQWALRAFSWTPETVEDDRAWVEARSSVAVRHRLPEVIPGYDLALHADPRSVSSPRVSMRLADELRNLELQPDGTWKVAVRVAMNFWRTERLPSDEGVVDPSDDRWHHYGVVLRVRKQRRSFDLKEGLQVFEAHRIQLGE